MELYVFSSSNLTNIWAGVGARRWGISAKQAQNPKTPTKAKAFRVGALGILYCTATKSFMAPFFVSSTPQASASVQDVWPEEWWFPFSIQPLGSPARQMDTNQISKLPSVAASGKTWNHILFVQPDFVFQPSTITDADWEILYTNLVS
ncbi:MAG: hypothetical protein OJF55_000095 [Rhodanobacteraceae bacterium]|jgi:hypothetical protein|nr:MAG: hypothetical protein OJF55_000095 [Rhodanobacteraceae bacterium]